MRINLPTDQMRMFCDSLENLADAVLQGKGDVTDEKLAAIFEYVGLKKNKETVNQAKVCIDEFREIYNDPEIDKKRALEKIARMGIPSNYAESVIGIFFGNTLQMQSTNKYVRSKMECPSCNNNELDASVAGKLSCSVCGATFLKEGGKYKLIEITDKASKFWMYGRNLLLTYQDWLKLKTCGYHVHFDSKANGYVPYIPDDYSEYKNMAPRYPFTLSPTTTTAAKPMSEAKRIEKSTDKARGGPRTKYSRYIRSTRQG